MSRARRRLALVAVLALAAACRGEPPPTAGGEWSVWLLRHAEKADDGTRDPPLDATGEARAAGLAARYADAGIVTLWTTDYRRTRDTVAPLAAAAGIPVESYDPRAPEDLVERLREAASDALVVGHSNTIPDLAARLCGCAVAPMEDDEYGRMFRVRFTGGEVTLDSWFETVDGETGTTAPRGTP